MVEKREKHRRQYKPITRFTLNTQVGGLIVSQRRRIPTRCVNDIAVKESVTKTLSKDCADTIPRYTSKPSTPTSRLAIRSSRCAISSSPLSRARSISAMTSHRACFSSLRVFMQERGEADRQSWLH